MRTTISLPDDLHHQAQSIARDTSQSLSEVIADLMRRGLGHEQVSGIRRSEHTGLPVVDLGTVITIDDVRALDDENTDLPA